MLINAYVSHLKRSVGWDFEDESPGNDARGFARGASPPEIESHLVNTVLTNGARFYVDHAHPEYSSPECDNARVATLYDKAGEFVLRDAMRAAAAIMPPGESIVVYKNNSDGKGNSYGCHENYLMSRDVPFTEIVHHIMPFFITRQIYAGAGKVGCELPGKHVEYQISQRADFIEEEVGLETTMKRPIVNTRDEPHGDADKYRRLHVIVGDANMSEFATFLKLGATSVVLAMIEDGMLRGSEFSLTAPVATIREVSCDRELRQHYALTSGKRITALGLQWEYLDLAKKYTKREGFEMVGGDEVGAEILDTWESVLSTLELDPMLLADRLDWVAKYQVIEGYRDRHGLNWGDAKLKAMDLQYHDMRPEKSLFAKLPVANLVEEKAAIRATFEPPRGTRAYFRGRCLEKWGSAVVAANWDSIVFDTGENSLRRIPMMDPLRGTAERVDELIDRCDSPQDLIKALGS